MNQSTSCKKCHFAQEASSSTPCEFHIPEAIANIKKIEIIDGYNYIYNYQCKYGVSSNKAEEIVAEHKVDIKEYAKNHSSLKYFLLIRVSGNDKDLENVCDNIKKLNIHPKAISIVFDAQFDTKNAKNICDKILSNKYAWKLHYFLEEKKDYEILHVVTANDQRLSKCQHIWILDADILEKSISLDSINNINFIVNVQQPEVSILHTRSSNNYVNGIFLLIENMKGITTYVDPDIGQAIEEKYKDSIDYYD